MYVLTESAWAATGVLPSDGALVACSGGADSVALLLECVRYRDAGKLHRLEAAHLNHGIRGAEADGDEAFCAALCQKYQVPLHTAFVDVPSLAAQTGESLELAARKARYAFLERVRVEQGLDCILLGHHRDDQAETVLLHLMRGSGLKGLCGMRVRSGRLVRPLLSVEKSALRAYLAEREQPYCTDSTNLTPCAVRNRVRQTVLPAMRAINPAISESLAGLALRAQADEAYLDACAKEAFQKSANDRQALSALPDAIRMRVLCSLLPYDSYDSGDLAALDALLTAQTGSTRTLKAGVTAWVDSKRLFVGLPDTPSYRMPLPIGATRLPHGVMRVQTIPCASFPCGANEAYLDVNRIQGVLTVRTPVAGDRFTPLGMQGEKRLSDVFCDRKVARFHRDVPLVCDDAGILFVTGYTVAERMRMTSESKSILYLVYEEDATNVG